MELRESIAVLLVATNATVPSWKSDDREGMGFSRVGGYPSGRGSLQL